MTCVRHNFSSSNKGKRKFPLLLLALCLFLTSCRNAGETESYQYVEPEEGVLTYAALNPITNSLRVRVEAFNSSHEDVQIEIRDYSDEGGIERLRLELMAGRVPDIMELRQLGESGEARISDGYVPISSNSTESEYKYWMPYRQLVQKGYLEDLWPYIESDPKLGREAVLEAPLKAAEINGGLYMLFKEFCITTLMGSAELVGDRYGWTFEELMETFSTMPDDSTILRYDATRWDVFSKLISFTLNQYVDWDNGQCFFDSEEFRNVIAFLNSFPAEFDAVRPPEEIEEEILWRITHGRQMLESTNVCSMREVIYKDAFWNGRASFVGYPTADGESGSLFTVRGDILAMSSACQNKEAAWDFIRQLIIRRHNRNSMKRLGQDTVYNTFVNRADYKLQNQTLIELGKSIDLAKDPYGLPPWRPFSAPIDIFPLVVHSEEDIQRYETLINKTTQLYWPDDALSDIVWEALGPYFAGDKTMDETIALVQDRVTLYINEQK